MPKKKKKDGKLPNELLYLPNKDKAFHEKWSNSRNMLNIPHPFRAVALGPPNMGKTNIVKNILIRAKPEFEEVFLLHCNGEYTKEYDDCNVQLLDEIPSPQQWAGVVKTLVIIDDLELKTLSKIHNRNLDRLFGHVSTHCNISVILCSQDAFNVPASIRRCVNLFILWKTRDLDSMATMARKSGMKSGHLNSIFEQLMMQPRDSLWIDLTDNSPFPLRKNGFVPISMSELGKESQKDKDNEDKFSII
jgi:hypothetical protein